MQVELQTVSAGQMGPKVQMKPSAGWTIGHVKRTLAERGCGAAADIQLIQAGACLADATLLCDLENPNGMIAATSKAPTKDPATVDDSLIERNLPTTLTLGPVPLAEAEADSRQEQVCTSTRRIPRHTRSSA